MKFWKKGSTAVALLAVTAVTLMACDGSSGKRVTEKSEDDKTKLTVITRNHDTTPELEKLFRAFEAGNPDITTEPMDIASDGHDTKATTVLSSGDTMDILTMKSLLSYPNCALRNQPVDLTNHIKDLDIESTKASYEMYEIDGKAYTQPYCADFWVLHYNKKMFGEVRITHPDNLTWDEYEALAGKLSKPEEQVYGTYQYTQCSAVQATTAAQNNANLIEPKYSHMETYYDRVLRV